MSETFCHACDTPIDVQTDEWWSHRWDEQPSRENVEAAIEAEDNGDEFRDWFNENYILCPDCHATVRDVVHGRATA